MAKINLKPCPFCGGKAQIRAVSEYKHRDITGTDFVIECSKCNVQRGNGRIEIGFDEDLNLVYKADDRLIAASKWNERNGE